ncbi:hypothetical protein GCM10017567_18650 [Amycolatopsis bullii]|uniref:Class II aldolase/adducin N-terminal domain-containing protein n=1 Tax=Amycolatopsis bullii TaxID=941987 RepID=A0ABQ3K4K6_9PSEU|nr:hypothetical protein GCM10017567_18650 [Amycolatopsis bullii]
MVHTHARGSVSFAALAVPLLPLSHDGALFAGEDVPRFAGTGGLISTPAPGRDLAAAPAALMPHHGLMAAGRTLAAAVMHAVLLDRACTAQLTALAAGPVRSWSGPAEPGRRRPSAGRKAGWRRDSAIWSGELGRGRIDPWRRSWEAGAKPRRT